MLQNVLIVVEIWNLKKELIKTLSHKISVTERNFEEKETVKAMSKGGYIWWVGDGGWWWMVA